MPLLRSIPTTTPAALRTRATSHQAEDGAIEGEFWVVARAVGLLIGGIVFLGWILG